MQNEMKKFDRSRDGEQPSKKQSGRKLEMAGNKSNFRFVVNKYLKTKKKKPTNQNEIKWF